jgi:hypothetical protein
MTSSKKKLFQFHRLRRASTVRESRRRQVSELLFPGADGDVRPLRTLVDVDQGRRTSRKPVHPTAPMGLRFPWDDYSAPLIAAISSEGTDRGAGAALGNERVSPGPAGGSLSQGGQMNITTPGRHRRPAQPLVTIECHDCQIPFDRMSSYGEAELLARVHDRLWHRGRPEATVVVLDLVVLDLIDAGRTDPAAPLHPSEPIRLAS